MFQQIKIASKVRNAIAKVISDKKIRTYDMLKMKGHPDVIKKGAASTKQMADAIIANI